MWAAGLATLAPGYPHGDSGETAGVALHLGIAHPPGYPLPTLLSHLAVRWVGVGGVAWRVSLLALAAAALAAALLARALRAWRPGLPAAVAFGAALAGGLALEVWNQMTLPKGCVYTVTVGLIAALAWALAAPGLPRGRRGATVGLGVGLAGGGHYMILAPLLPFLGAEFLRLLGPASGERDAAHPPAPVRAIGLALAACALGASLYLYLPLRTPTAHPAFRWAEPVTWKRFGWLALRRQYLNIEKQERGNSGSLLLRRFGDRLVGGWGWPGPVALAGALALAVISRSWWLAAFAAGGALEIIAAALYPKLEADALWVADPFFSAGWFAWGAVLSGGIALAAAGARWRGRAAGVLAAVLVVTALTAGFGRVSKRWNYCASDQMANLAATLPRDALLFTEGDANIAPLLYGLFVDGARPDVRMVIPIFLYFSWGLHQLGWTYPDLALKAGTPWGNIWQETKDLMEAQPARPWCYTQVTSAGWPFGAWALPEGVWYRIRPGGPARPPDPAVDRGMLRWRLRDTLSERMDRDPFGRVVREEYRQGYFLRATRWHLAGDRARALALFDRARRLGSPEAALNAGLVRWEMGDAAGATADWREARVLAPDRPEPYANLALSALRSLPPRPDEAIRLCDEALARDGRFAKAHELAASAWFTRGDLPRALDHLREAIRLRPGDPGLRQALAAMLRRRP